MEGLSHSCLETPLTHVVWTSDTFENNFEIKIRLEKYLDGEFLVGFRLHFSFEGFLKIA